MRSFITICVLVALALMEGRVCAQELLDAAAPPDIQPASEAQLTAADAANLEGCRKIAQIDDQIVLACDVLWRVNQLLEEHQRAPGAPKVPEEQLRGVRQQLMRREVATMVDRKLIYSQFRHNVPADNLPRIEQSLREPFEEREIPDLMKKLNVDNKADLEKELARLGSSLADVRRTFNERVIASEWIRSKVKVNEDVSPDELLDYYKAHLADYDFPSQARWEELMVRKDKYKSPGEAYAAIAQMGNDVWQTGTQKPVRGAAFADIAKAKSDGFTAKDGGVHDWTTKGALSCKPLDDALFTLKVGQMSSIIDGGAAFHIVRVLERKEAGRKPFTDVQGDIRDRLKEQRFQREADKYLTKLRQDARIWTAFTGNVSAQELMARRPDDSQRR